MQRDTRIILSLRRIVNENGLARGAKKAYDNGIKRKGERPMSKTLVAYFSASGTTAKAAAALARAAEADLYEIKPRVPYTRADLNWMDKKSRSTLEMNDRASRPAIVTGDLDVAGYDTVLLGFPIWWYVAPTIINTFLEAYDFAGKKIVLFATSGGSGFGKAVEGLRPSAPGADIREGRLLNGRLGEDALRAWAAAL